MNAPFPFYQPEEYELERASHSYLMSVIFITFALPLSIINLIATIVFLLANRNGTSFVRWHCIQALLSQFSLFIINSLAFVWVILMFFHVTVIDDTFIALLIVLFVFNVWEFAETVNAAIKTRKGIHVKWFFYGILTDKICKL